MSAIFLSTLNPVMTMLLFIVIGFALGKLKFFPDNADATLSKLAGLVISPVMTILTFSKYCTVESLGKNLTMLLVSAEVCLTAVGIACLLGGIFSRDGYRKNVYRYALAFSNSGYMGNPLVLAILGEQGLYLYLLFCIPITLMIYIWGVNILIPREKGQKFSWKQLMNPCIIGVIIGMFLGLTGIGGRLPNFVTGTLQGLSDTLGPIAMLLTGLVIAKFDPLKIVKKPAVYVATALRLLVLPAVFLGALLLLKVDSTTVKLCLFAYATPLGLNTVVFPLAYGGDPSTGASMALVSHVLCVATIPLLYSILSLLLT